MKAKHIGILLLALLSSIGCDDNTGTLGLDMLPESDALSAHTTTFDVITQSVIADNVYSKTSTGYVGRFTDPIFGYYESSFLTEMNCTDHFTFPEAYTETEWDANGNATKATGEIAGDSVVATALILYYNTWFGDSLNACRMSIYELNDEWLNARHDPDNYRYTNLDATRYYNPDALLGRKAYTAYDTSVPDSVRYGTDSYGNSTYYPSLNFTLSKEFGNRILQLNRAYARGENNYFDNAETFINNVFPGIYVKSDYGDGTILYIYQASLQMQFRLHAIDAETGVKLKKQVTDEQGDAGSDSLYYGWRTFFASTREVIQSNQFTNSEKILERVNEKNWTYLKSPAGIFTEATLPCDEIDEQLANDTLNAIKLTFTNYAQKDEYEFAMSEPSTVLLVRKQDANAFFEQNQLTDNMTSFTATHNSNGTNEYTFNNIARLINTCINEKNAAREAAGSSWNEEQWEAENPDWNKVWLIPVTLTYDTNSSSQNPPLIGIQNDLQPGYVKLKGGPETDSNGKVKNPLKLEVTYTTFHNNN